jgi:hypothetical protein
MIWAHFLTSDVEKCAQVREETGRQAGSYVASRGHPASVCTRNRAVPEPDGEPCTSPCPDGKVDAQSPRPSGLSTTKPVHPRAVPSLLDHVGAYQLP